MGLFNNNKKNEVVERERTYLANMEGDAYFSLINSTFIGKFDEEQKEALTFAMEHGLPHQAYAYEELPAEYMKCINKYGEHSYRFPFQAIDIWKAVNSGLEYPQFEIVIHALTFGLKMVDEIPHLRVYDKEVLDMALVIFYRTKKNLCHMITPTMDKEAFMKKCKKMIAKQDKGLDQALEMEKYSKDLF